MKPPSDQPKQDPIERSIERAIQGVMQLEQDHLGPLIIPIMVEDHRYRDHLAMLASA